MVSRLLVSLAAFALAAAPVARAEQQAPSQYSPEDLEYHDADTEALLQKNAEEKQTSSVTFSWSEIPMATHYLIKISRDPEVAAVFQTIDTYNTTYQTPELTPGAYYYIVQGYQEGRLVGQTGVRNFVIGKPVQLEGKREKLAAPTIIGPKHLDLFPTYGYVRLAWVPVEGARGYRFRLWNEDRVKENTRWKRDTPPRWITEVKQPWIEVHDAPYTSYMYLESGTYRWDVAAVDKDGGYVGEPAMGFFRVSRQWFFKPHEIFLNAHYLFEPQSLYYQDSSVTGQQNQFASTSHRLDADLDWWFFRQWGLNAGGGFQSLNEHSSSPSAPFDTLLYIHANADLLFRTYLSTVPWGWWLTFNLGFGMQELPQIDDVTDNIHVSRPKALGARLGFRVNKRWNSPWEAEFRFNTLIHAFTTSAPTGATRTGTPFDGEMSLKAVYNWSYHFATEFGIGGQLMRQMYTPAPFAQRSNVLVEGINFVFGVRFNYYPPPNNTEYYPDREGAYYPSERTEGYYRSEEKNIDEYHRDSSAWQRWRPR